MRSPRRQARKWRQRSLSVVFAALTATCTGDSTTAPGPAVAASLQLNPTSLSLAAIQGDSAFQTFSVISAGGPVQWSASADSSWLSVSPSSGTTPSTITVVGRTSNLAPTMHGGSITIVGAGVSNSPQKVVVSLAVGARLTVSASTLTFAGDVGQSTIAAQTINVKLGGSTTTSWSTSKSADWISITPASGAGDGMVSVGVNTSGLVAGGYQGSITIVASGASGSPVTIPVALTLTSPRVSISATATPPEGGSVTGGGTYAVGDVATLAAAPASGFAFVSWSENGVVVATTATYSFLVAQARALTATFGPSSVMVTTASNPTTGGTTAGGGTVTRGSTVTVTATPTSGFTFTNWTENGAIVSASASYTFSATADRTLVANFTPAIPSTFTITTSANPAASGSTSGGGAFASGMTATVTATATAGYTFTNWTESGIVVATAPSYSFSVAGNRTLVANFTAAAPATYTISTSSNPAAGGSTTGGGAFASGATATVTAIPAIGYRFNAWSEGGNIVSASASYSFTVTMNRALTANFVATSTSYSLTTSVNPPGAGTTSGDGVFSAGSTATATATANAGYAFVNWTENGSVVSTSASYSYVVAGNRTLVANFAAQGPTYVLVTPSNPVTGGTTTGQGVYPAQSNVTITATPAAGFTFVNWTEGGAVLATTPSLTIAMTSNRTITANFSTTQTFVITTSTSDAEAGSVAGGGTYHNGDFATLTATPNPGYYFAWWTDLGTGTIISPRANPTYTFVVTGNRSLEASFGRNQYFVGLSSNPSAGGLAQGAGFHTGATTVTIMAVANNGYVFRNWTENGAVVSTSAAYSFVIVSNRVFVANFDVLPPSTVSISTRAVPDSAGSTSGGGTYAAGANVTVTATPRSGFVFSKWTENGPTVSTSASYTFTANSNHFLEAQFVPSGSMNPSPPTPSQGSSRTTAASGTARNRQTARGGSATASGTTHKFAP